MRVSQITVSTPTFGHVEMTVCLVGPEASSTLVKISISEKQFHSTTLGTIGTLALLEKAKTDRQ